MPEPLVVIGAAGHARAVLEVIRAQGSYGLAGLIDSYQTPGSPCLGSRVLGGEQDLHKILADSGINTLFIAIGDNYQRAAMYERIRDRLPGLRLASCIHPGAQVAADAEVGAGSVLMPGAVVVSGSRIGVGCIVNTRCSLDHDSAMADWSSLAPGATTGGRVKLGYRSSLGLGANVIQGISIGQDVVIGAGALVLDDVPDGVLAYGAPCRTVRTRAADEKYL